MSITTRESVSKKIRPVSVVVEHCSNLLYWQNYGWQVANGKSETANLPVAHTKRQMAVKFLPKSAILPFAGQCIVCLKG